MMKHNYSRYKGNAVVDFASTGSVNTSAGLGNINLNAAGLSVLSSRFAAVCDQYGLYRILKFAFRLIKLTSVDTTAAAVLSELQDTSPGTVGAIYESLYSQIFAAYETSKRDWVRVPQKIVGGALPWYKAIPGTPDAWNEIPATLYVINNTSVTGGVGVEVQFTCEFKDPVAPAYTPQARLERTEKAREAERLGLLRLLTGKVEQNIPKFTPLCGKPPPAPARSDNEQTRPVLEATGDSQKSILGSKLPSKTVGPFVMDCGC